ncbi:MAG: hypothetical protein IJR55_03280 [Clostridia bacterium]|nr:hypothetical protein [Clostridia bacterium]
MKKIAKIISIMLVLCVAVLALASCAKTLSGTYSSSGSLLGIAGGKTSYTFSGNKVTLTVTTEILGSSSTDEYAGTYEIKEATDGTQQITLTFTDSDASSYSGTFSFAEGKDDNGVATVTIGRLTYTKTK